MFVNDVINVINVAIVFKTKKKINHYNTIVYYFVMWG